MPARDVTALRGRAAGRFRYVDELRYTTDPAVFNERYDLVVIFDPAT